MQKDLKIIFGVLSFVPIILMIISFTMAFEFLIERLSSDQMLREAEIKQLAISTFILFCGSILGLILVVTFIIFTIKDKSAGENDQVIWILLLLFINLIILPFYWYIRLWSNPDFDMKDKVTDRSN